VINLGLVSAVTNVSSCGTLSTANETYVLNQSLSSSGTCITIGADNITLDCGYYGTRYLINGTGSNYGAYVNGKNNTTVKNCDVFMFNTGIYVLSSNNGYYLNNNVSNNTRKGFFLVSSSWNLIDNNQIMYNDFNGDSYGGLGLRISSSYNNITNNHADYNVYYAFWLDSSDNNYFINNSISDFRWSGVYFSTSSYNSFVNTTIIKTTGLISPEDLIPASYYFSGESYSHFQNYIDTTNKVDGLPVMYYDGNQNPCPNNTVLDLDSNYSLIGFLGCTNVTLIDTAAIDGIWLSYTSNSNFTNLNSSYSDFGFRLYASSNNSFMNNLVRNNTEGFMLYGFSYNNTFINNIIERSMDGFFVRAYCENNSFINNTLTNNIQGVTLYEAENNYFKNNTIVENVGGFFEIKVSVGFNFILSSNNTLENNHILLSGILGDGITFDMGSNNNLVEGNNIKTNGSSSNGVYFFNYGENPTNNLIKDTSLEASNWKDINSEGTGMNNFTNCTFNKSRVSITNGSINVFWYADVYVNDTEGNDVEGANITVENSSGGLVNYSLTDESGNAERFILREYWQNSTDKYFDGNYTINASKTNYSNDSKAINLTESEEIVFTLENLNPEESPHYYGGGGSIVSEWVKEIKVNDSSLNIGQTLKDLKKDYRVTFNVTGMGHNLDVKNITGRNITFVIASTPQTATLSIGETRKFNLDGDSYYDLSVTLNSIVNGNAEIYLKTISEQINPASQNQNPDTGGIPVVQTGDQNLQIQEPKKEEHIFWWVILIGALVGLFIFFALYRRNG
jgi:parallel beta-helix repeat protein